VSRLGGAVNLVAGTLSRVDRPGPRRVAHVLAVIVLLSAVAPFVVFAVPQVVGAEHSYVVLSGSMEPVMAPGDVVIVDEVPADSIAVGDVVTYSRDGGRSTTTHRVVGFVETDADGTTFRTKGDANPGQDLYLVRRSQVVGKVVYVIPYIGYVVGFAGTSVGQVLLVAVPLLLLVLNEMWRRVGRPKSTERRPSSPSATNADPDEHVVATLTVAERTVDRAAPSGSDFAVAQRDLSMSGILLVVLVAYSGWNAYRSVAAAAPDLASVMIFAGSTTGLVLLGGARLSAARRGSNLAPTVDDDGVPTEGVVREVDERDAKPVEEGTTASTGRSTDEPADADGGARGPRPSGTGPRFPGTRTSSERSLSRHLERPDEAGDSGTITWSEDSSFATLLASETLDGGGDSEPASSGDGHVVETGPTVETTSDAGGGADKDGGDKS
jgi:signal peptidase